MPLRPATFQDYENLCARDSGASSIAILLRTSQLISDEAFDRLYQRLEEIEKQHPDWIVPTSPTQRVGEALTEGFKTIEHRVPMLSLANTYSKEEIADFIKRVQKLTERPSPAFSCELKMDGIAISATYERGVFVQAVTRGDGYKGDEITANLRTLKSIPLRLYGKNVPELLEIRGEVFMPHAVFKELNDEKAKTEEPLWANPRNAAAGSLKLLDPHEVAKRRLAVVSYAITENSALTLTSQYECHNFLQALGLPTLQMHVLSHSLDEIWSFAEKVHKQRHQLEYDIDGIVIKLDDLREQKRLGTTGKNPRWAIAYKFAAEQAITRIREITVQVGRTGILTPVAELDPVFLAGSTIARATLHNEDEIKRKDIRIGDVVTIEKGGDVIPKVVSVDTSKRHADSQPWHMPQHCPICGTKVIRTPGEVAVRCPNRASCSQQFLRRLIHFVGKEAMDIEGMGKKVCEHLIAKGFVHHPSDVYRLSEQQLFQLEGFQMKSVQNLLVSIDKSRDVSLARFIMALGIDHVGVETAELLANRSGSIQTLMDMSGEELMQIPGIGDKVAHAIVEYFKEERNRKEIFDLLNLGLTPRQQKVLTYRGHTFEGKIFVLTGTLDHYTRQGAATLIKERGGKVTDSVSKKTDFVLAGHDPGSKLEKAHSLGIQILDEAQFIKML